MYYSQLFLRSTNPCIKIIEEIDESDPMSQHHSETEQQLQITALHIIPCNETYHLKDSHQIMYLGI